MLSKLAQSPLDPSTFACYTTPSPVLCPKEDSPVPMIGADARSAFQSPPPITSWSALTAARSKLRPLDTTATDQREDRGLLPNPRAGLSSPPLLNLVVEKRKAKQRKAAARAAIVLHSRQAATSPASDTSPASAASAPASNAAAEATIKFTSPTAMTLTVVDDRTIGQYMLLFGATLRNLDLSGCGTGISAVGISHLKAGHIDTLTMEGMRLGLSEAVELAQIPSLQCLYVARNQIGDTGAKLLARHASLRILDISVNPLTDIGVIALCQQPTLESLRIGGIDFTLAAAEVLARHPRLRELSIDHLITADQRIFTEISRNRKLQNAYFDGNALTDDTIAHVARESTFQHLSLRGCQLSGSHLATLAYSPQLTSLNLAENPMPSTHCLAIVNAPNLRCLNLENNGIDAATRMTLSVQWMARRTPDDLLIL